MLMATIILKLFISYKTLQNMKIFIKIVIFKEIHTILLQNLKYIVI